MFVYHFVDPDLRIEIFFKNKGAAEYVGVDFKIGGTNTSSHLYWRLKKIAS